MRINLSPPALLAVFLTLAAGPAVRAQSSYSSVVLADGPAAYLRLNETNGTTAFDSAGNSSGQYQDVTLAQPGFASPVDPEYSAAFGPGPNSHVGGIPGLDGGSNALAFSVECWLAGGSQQTGATIISHGNPGREQYFMDFGGANNGLRFMVNGTNLNLHGASSSYTLDGYWHHVVGVIDQAGITTGGTPLEVLYVDGQALAGDSFGGRVYAPATGTPTSIGSRQSAPDSAYDLNFIGRVNELAVYKYPLTAAQVATHFNARWGANTPPPIIIGSQPSVVSSVAGVSATLGVTAQGSAPLSYQWYQNGDGVAGETNSTLTLEAGEAGEAGNYLVVITNSVGSVTSSVVTIPAVLDLTSNLVLHLKFDNTYTDSSGAGHNATPHGSPTFVRGLIGPSAFAYSADAGGPFYYASLGVVPDLEFSSNVNFSLSYWIQYPNVPDNNEVGLSNAFPACDLPIFGNAVASTYNPGYVFAQCGENCEGNPGAWIWTLDDGTNSIAAIGATNSVDDGQWHNLIHTFDRSGSAITYLDGVPVDVTPIFGLGSIDTTNATTIGNDPTGAYDSAGAGNLDDLGVWRRVLSPAEAQSLYLGGLIAGATFGTPATLLTLFVKRIGSHELQLTWTSGTLVSAATVQGPWTPIPGAVSPLAVTTSGASQFYRLMQ